MTKNASQNEYVANTLRPVRTCLEPGPNSDSIAATELEESSDSIAVEAIGVSDILAIRGRWLGNRMFAIAICFVLLAIGTVDFIMSRTIPDAVRLLFANNLTGSEFLRIPSVSHSLASILESRLDEQREDLMGVQATAIPHTTYKSTSGQFCREYDLKLQCGTAYSGVACRADIGAWIVHVSAQIQQDQSDGRYRPASGVNPKLTEFIVRTRTTRPFKQSHVKKLIERGWK